jgi:hypothetical protein
VRFSAASITNTGGKGWPREGRTAQKAHRLDTAFSRMTDECSAGAHPVMVALAARAGAQHQAPRPTLFVDFGEQNPFNLSCVSGWSEGIEEMEAGEGTRWFICVPRSSLPLVQVQRLRSDPVRQQCTYYKDKRMVCISYRSEFEVIRNFCVRQVAGAPREYSKRSNRPEMDQSNIRLPKIIPGKVERRLGVRQTPK